MDSFYTSYRPGLSGPKISSSLGSTVIRRAYHNVYATHASARRAIWLIIGLNTAIFGTFQWAQYRGDRSLQSLILDNTLCSWAQYNAGKWWTLITCAFTHFNLAHFAFNMLTLHAFCSIVSWAPGVGGAHIIGLALGSAVAGSYGWLWHRKKLNGNQNPQSNFGRPSARHGPTDSAAAVGASGVVMGVGAAATCLMPFAPMNLMFIPIRIPLWAMTLAYAAVDIYYLDNASSRVGHAGHLGGSIFGLVYYFAYLRRMGGIWPMLTSRMRR